MSLFSLGGTHRRRHLARPAQPGEGLGGDGLEVKRLGLHQRLHEAGEFGLGQLLREALAEPTAQMVAQHLAVLLRLLAALLVQEGQHLHQAAVHDQRGQALGQVLVVVVAALGAGPGIGRTFDRAAEQAEAAGGEPAVVGRQRIARRADQRLRGFESLSRFDIEPRHTPDRWFDKAARAGLGQELELLAITKALAALNRLPGECSLSVNCSPELILSGQLSPVLAPLSDLSRVVLEVTEHAAVHDYGALADALAPYRQHGARLAVDDAGAGYSSMRHILNLAPEIIKLDMSITHCIDTDDKRRALARGLTSFAHEIGSLVIAEGVETFSELEQLQRLSVDCAQGYLLSKPLELAAAAGFGNSA